MLVDVTTWYLEMLRPEELRRAPVPGPDVRVVRAEVPSPELNRFLYTAVGGDWRWTDRLCWTYQDWLEYLDRPELETWVAYFRGTPAGFVELEAQPEGNVQIMYFGLLPRFIGKGIGGYLLAFGIERAWQMRSDTRRVRVHTCTTDGPHALPNYRARGLRIYKVETAPKHVIEKPIGPWPGCR